MILRRLSEAIREQNWFTVIIEISMVVVGIFIGLQADAWNQDRLDRKEERDYLLRLKSDVEQDLETLSFGRRLAATRIEQIRFLESVVRNPSIAAETPSKFLTNLEVAT